jgi:hypothetical protein
LKYLFRESSLFVSPKLICWTIFVASNVLGVIHEFLLASAMKSGCDRNVGILALRRDVGDGVGVIEDCVGNLYFDDNPLTISLEAPADCAAAQLLRSQSKGLSGGLMVG